MNFLSKKIASTVADKAVTEATTAIETHVESNKKTYIVGGVCLAVGYFLGTKRVPPSTLIVKL